MNDIAGLVAFSSLPMLLVFAFSFVTPGVGMILSLRNEIMLALALPSVAHAGMALGLLLGIDGEHPAHLYLFAAPATLAAAVFAVKGTKNGRTGELRPAGLFAAGQTLSLLITSLSSTAHAHVAHLLNGEVMAAGTLETMLILLLCAGVFITGVLSRQSLYSWCADEQFFRIGKKHPAAFTFTLYSLIVLIVTIGVATVGQLLITALMVFPALFGDCRKKGVGFYSIMVLIIGITGSVAGFISALVLDLPPAVCAAAGVGLMGIGVRVCSGTRFISQH